MNSFELNDGYSGPSPILDRHRSYTNTNNTTRAEEDARNRVRPKPIFGWSPLIFGIVVGALLAGVVLATVTTLWVTTTPGPSPNSTVSTARKTSSTSSTSSTSTTSSTSSTSSTSTTSTSTTSSTTSTSTTTVTTQTTTICSTTGLGTFMSVNGVHSWTQFSGYYTATTTTPILSFAFTNGPGSYTYLDHVSIVDNSAPSIELLDNGSFENSTSIPPTGWVTWCSSTCYSTSIVSILSTSSCYSSSGNCYANHCYSGPDFLAQSFSTTINNTYTISFWWQQTGGGLAQLYVDVI